jgi:hypothetical protein
VDLYVVWHGYTAFAVELSELKSSDIFFTVVPGECGILGMHFSKLILSFILAIGGL